METLLIAVTVLSLGLEMFVLPTADVLHQGWAARSLFLFSALALAAISLSTLHMESAPEKDGSADDLAASA